MKNFSIQAIASNCMPYYYCDCSTQGERMVPNASSYAAKFDSRKDAANKINKLKNQWKGLTAWVVFNNE